MTTRTDPIDPCVEVMLPATEFAVSIVRSIVRRLVAFDDDEDESAYLVALTEIMSNAVDEHARSHIDSPISMTVRLGTDAAVVVTARAGATEPDQTGGSTPTRDTVAERGITLARAFVPELDIASGPDGSTVTLPLAGFGSVR